MTSISRLHTFRHLWGVTLPLEQAAQHFGARGYDGLESHFGDASARKHARAILGSHGLKNIAMTFTQPDPVAGHSIKAYLESLERSLEESLETDSVCIVVHAGYDAWSDFETLRFFEGALERVCHKFSGPRARWVYSRRCWSGVGFPAC